MNGQRTGISGIYHEIVLQLHENNVKRLATTDLIINADKTLLGEHQQCFDILTINEVAIVIIRQQLL